VSRAMLRTVAGRPGLRRLLVSYLLAASLRCQVLAAELSAHELAAFGVHAAAGLGEDG
jgi:hypothetical protein